MDMDELNNDAKEAIKILYREKGKSLTELKEKFDDFFELQEEYSDYILVSSVGSGITAELTNEGEKAAEELLDISAPDVDNIGEQAEEVLENDPLEYFLDSIDKVFKGNHLLKIWELLTALSAKCSDKQISSWAIGQSGSGKSSIKRKIIKYLPEESYMVFNSISSKALLYYTKKEGSDFFKNKLLFFDEVEASEEAVPILRSLTDPDGDKIRHLTVQEQEGQDIILEKPMAVWFTSVDLLQDEQLKNRFLITNPDSSKNLDQLVHEHQKKILHKGGDLDRIPKEAPIFREVVKDLRSNTYDLSLVIPFDIDWKQHFNRRLYPYFCTLMELITKVYYRNREIRDDKIVATQADFQLAAKIWTELIETTIAQEDEEAIELAQTLPSSRDKALTTSEIAERLDDFGTNKVRRKALNMIHTEDLNLVNGEKRSNRWHFWAGKDLDRLVNPEPEIIDDVDYMEHFIKSKVDIEFDEDIINTILDTEIEVVDYLSEKGVKVGNLDSGRVTPNALKEMYPEDEPEDFEEIEERATEEFDIDEDKFFDMHQTLEQDGEIMSPERGKWMTV